MTLTGGALTAVQGQILSDATPFGGTNIAHTGDAMTLTAGERAAINAAIVVAHGVALPSDVTTSTTTITGAITTAQTAINTNTTTATGAVTVAPGGIGPTAIAANAINAASIAAAAVTKIQSGLSTLDATAAANAVWDALLTAHSASGSFGEFVKALPSVSTIATAVWAVSDGTMTKGAALDLLRRRTTNKRILSALGILSFFADDGVTVEKTSTVRDVNGVLVSPVSGEAAQASAEV